MTRRKSDFKRTLVLVLIVCPSVFSRPQETLTTSISAETTESPLRQPADEQDSSLPTVATVTSESTSREVKNKSPVIKDSIKKVANQLLDKPGNVSLEGPVVPDTRVPPKIKTQIEQKHKIRTRNEDEGDFNEHSHAGVAVPMTMEELELENKVSPSLTESSTSNEGISTWILLNNPVNKENSTIATEATKVDENKKSKPAKTKSKKPQNKTPLPKRPIIGSTNKSDLVASGSAINENVYNKIKDTVLTNVQKNKNGVARTTTTSTTTTTTSTTEAPIKESTSKEQDSITPVIKVTSKPTKKKEKIKRKTSTTIAPVVTESAMLPMEPKEQEIELEVSTPPTTTKKPKRSSTKKKTKTKKRKTPKPTQTSISTELKTANETKTTKTSKKPVTSTGPFTSQIYSYFSREVMPSVGVGVIGLAGLVGIASYFLYPFTTPVRRTFEVDKKDDIYKNNAEEYANEGNGQPEEEMLGTVLAGMPAHAKQKLNPYAAQTNYNTRYPVKKDQQDIRYRHVTKYDPNYGVHYPQQKTGIAHGAVYSEPLNYHRRPQYETRHAYTTSYPAVEPIYAAPQTGPSEVSSYGSDHSGSVVYGVKPSADTDFKPVYPYDTFYGETTSSPVTYSPTSMYLGSNNEAEQEDSKYNEEENTDSEDNKFVVGNVPKELTESDTPAVVPEHGPRKLNSKRRSLRSKRGVAIEEMLKAADKKEKEVFLSNEIDEALGYAPKIIQSIETLPLKTEIENNVIPIYAVSVNPSEVTETNNAEIIESVSTLPIENYSNNDKTTNMFSDIETTTKSSNSQSETENGAITNIDDTTNKDNIKPATITEQKLEASTTSTIITETSKRPTDFPEILTYPPPSSGNGFLDFLQRVVEFKYRLGLSILQNTSKSLNRYLRSMEESIQRAAADASH